MSISSTINGSLCESFLHAVPLDFLQARPSFFSHFIKVLDRFHAGHLTGTHFLLSLSFVGQPAPPFFSLLMIFLTRNFLPLLHFLEHSDHGDQPVTKQSLFFSGGQFVSLHRLHLIRELKSGHGFPPCFAFCRIVRERNRPPLLHEPRHSLQGDQGDSLQLTGLGLTGLSTRLSRHVVSLLQALDSTS